MSQPTIEQVTLFVVHQLQRLTEESKFVNTIKVSDRVTIDFVWYPGARRAELDSSLVHVVTPVTPPASAPRLQSDISYTWTPVGGRKITRIMTSGRITLPLPPGGYGVLNVFDTDWDITRAAKGEPMPAFDRTGMGALVRLNTLGYHLRDPGDRTDFTPEAYGPNGERAVLAFQVDYREPAPQGGTTTPLRVRGEIGENAETWSHLKQYNAKRERNPSSNDPDFNPTIDDGSSLEQALLSVVG